jgi:ATP-GRASP peptide maturase of grasp-with-spasm system
MILIISEKEDHSTSEVIQWLRYYNADFKRINRGDHLIFSELSIEGSSLNYTIFSQTCGTISITDIKAIWYRRGEVWFTLPSLDFVQNPNLKAQMIQHMRAENNVLEAFFQYLLNSIPHIGTFAMRGTNKLIVLNEAKKLGIDIPETFVVSEKSRIRQRGKMITKSISETFSPVTEAGNFMTYTELIDYNHLTHKFFPSLFQNLVEKEADIRIFYLLGEMSCMAIQSQNNAQTSIDFRKYLPKDQRPSRYLPFNLPNSIKEKLQKLMPIIGLETASIDMVFTKDGRFVFLEANPVGQFSMTSKPCNYFLEREIALSLINLTLKHS